MMAARSFFAFLLSASALLGARSIEAEEFGDDSMFSINGYGTLGIAHSSDDRADYVADIFRPDGAGYTRDWSFGIDSRLGIQITATFTPKLSALLQFVSEQRYDNRYMPVTEWAYISYQLAGDFSIKAGRMLEPSFLYADSRKVGYAYPWVRPPAETYRLVPVTYHDGVNLGYRRHFGETTATVDVMYSNRNIRSPKRIGGGVSESRDQIAIFQTLEYGPVTLNLSYHRVHLTIPFFGSLFNAFRQFGPEGIAIAERYEVDNALVKFFGVGVNYDPGNWFAMAEWGRNNYHSVLGEQQAWYVSGGYRLGDVTPYASFARFKIASNTSDPGLTLSALPPQLAGPAAGLNGALNGILSGSAQKTTGVGLRWDFMSNAALKLQYEYIRRGDGSPGLFVNRQPGFAPGGDAELFSATIDFVF